MSYLEEWLEKNYPANVFTGVSGDSGAVFVNELRKLINNLNSTNGEERG